MNDKEYLGLFEQMIINKTYDLNTLRDLWVFALAQHQQLQALGNTINLNRLADEPESFMD